MKREIEIKGNTFIYCFFQISNICLCVLGFFTFGIAIYFITLSRSLNYLNCLFLLFGLILVILSYFGCKLRKAPLGNFFYSVILTIIFLLDFIITIIMLADGNNIIATMMESYETSVTTREEVKKIISMNFIIIRDLLLIVLFIFVNYFHIFSLLLFFFHGGIVNH